MDKICDSTSPHQYLHDVGVPGAQALVKQLPLNALRAEAVAAGNKFHRHVRAGAHVDRQLHKAAGAAAVANTPWGLSAAAPSALS